MTFYTSHVSAGQSERRFVFQQQPWAFAKADFFSTISLSGRKPPHGAAVTPWGQKPPTPLPWVPAPEAIVLGSRWETLLGGHF